MNAPEVRDTTRYDSPAIMDDKQDITHAELSADQASDDLNSVIDKKAEKKLLWKLDLHVLPPLMVLFMLSFLDRTNIGNARIQGLEKDLGMEGSDFNIALFIFFVPYILLEVPSNIVIKKIAPSTYLSIIVFLWGVITVAQGLVTNFAGLVAMRFLIGVFEAGLVPGGVYIISMYYKRFELQWRLSIFLCSSIVAGSFSGLFAYALAKMDGLGGYGGWRWIFIIEGILTCIIAAGCKWWLVDWPEDSKFLTDAERAMLVRRLAVESGEARMDHLNKKAVMRILKDWKIYCAILMYAGAVCTGYATAYFNPTIIRQMGYTAEASQVRVIPIFMAAAVTALCIAYLTDRTQHRYGFAMSGVVVGTIGYAIFLNQEKVSIGTRYLACFLVTIGGYMVQPVCWCWLANNVSGHYKRSVATAMQIGFGNLGGIAASNVFLANEAPTYTFGYGFCLAMLLMCGLMCTVFMLGLLWENKQRDAGKRDYRYHEADIDNMGDDHPSFRFAI